MYNSGPATPLYIGRHYRVSLILSGEQQNGDTTRTYLVSCSSKTPDVNFMRSPYGNTLLLEFVWLVTCVLRNHNNGV